MITRVPGSSSWRVYRSAAAIGGAALLACILFPVYFLVVSSLRPADKIFAYPPSAAPVPLSLGFYRIAIGQAPIDVWLRNSAIVVIGTLALCLPLATMAAYGLARFDFRGKRSIARLMLLLYLFPSVLLLVPLFVIMARFSLDDNLFGLMVAHATFGLPFSVWFLTGYFQSIPVELDEAAQIDGSGHLGVLWRILVPILAPGLAATAAFIFMFSWNDFAFANVLIQDANLRTLSVGVTSYFSAQGIPWGVVLATSVLMTLPVVVAVQIAQRYFVGGLASGAVK
jgi:ABC-type glycerol-3-phosphate transport system permease component